jgi:predicted ATP-grasp superfamily ATP-dependent carboligase
MMEFMYDTENKIYYLIEINPKLWGSLELAIFSGVDFGVAIVSSALNDGKFKRIQWCKKQVSWVLDGDLVNIFKTRNWSALSDYFKPNHKLVLGENLFSIFLKCCWSIQKIMSGRS